MPASLSALADDGWEYEYDPNSTEDFFITLDLTSRCAPRKKHSLKGHVHLRQSFHSANNGPSQQQPAAADDDDDNADLDDPDDESRIQILGLHDKNPIISYGGQIYTCEWASALGTDLFFLKRPDDRTNGDIDNDNGNGQDEDDNPPLTPLRSLPTHDLIGATSARLIAQTANLIPRTDTSYNTTNQSKPNRRPFINQADSRFTVPADAPDTEHQQAAFLGRLQAVKRRLGETDEVRDRSYNNRSLRWRGAYGGGEDERVGDEDERVGDEDERAGDDEDGSDNDDDAEGQVNAPVSTRQQPAPRPYKRRKPRRGKYDTLEPRYVSGGPSREVATPETWDQLDGTNGGGREGNVGDVHME